MKRRWLVAWLVVAGTGAQSRQPGLNESVEQEVEQNIRSQAIGSHTVGDLGLSESLIRRFRDRVIRASFEDRYRVVVADAGGAAGATSVPPAAPEQPALAAAPQVPGPNQSGTPSTPPSPLPWIVGSVAVIGMVTLAMVLRKGARP